MFSANVTHILGCESKLGDGPYSFQKICFFSLVLTPILKFLYFLIPIMELFFLDDYYYGDYCY